MKTRIWIGISVYVLVAIVKKRMHLPGHSMKILPHAVRANGRPMSYPRNSTPTKIQPTRITKLICSINLRRLQVVPRGAV